MKWRILGRCVPGLLLLAFSVPDSFAARAPEKSPEKKPAKSLETRRAHARELLGKYYSKSVAAEIEKLSEVSHLVRLTVSQSLRSEWKKEADSITRVLIEESDRYQVDPFFLIAVITHESSFNPDARGKAGEIGLMQIMPSTGAWIADIAKLKWKGTDTLKDPVTNIRIGAAYLAMLREEFDSSGRLYLAAYNMGPRKLQRKLAQKVTPKEYPSMVMKKYLKIYLKLKDKLDEPSAEAPIF